MKTIFFVSMFCFAFCASVYAQNFYVIKVEGKAFLNDQELKTGDKLTSESTVTFSAPTDKIYLLSPNNGYFLLSPEKHHEGSSGLLTSLKNAVIPQNKYYQTATRGLMENSSYFEDIYDLMGFFKDSVLIIGQGKFSVNPENIKLDSSHFFNVEQISDGDAVPVKIDGNSFYLQPGNNGENVVMTYVQNGGKTRIGDFKLKKVSRKTLSEELSVFFNESAENNSTFVYYEQVLPYIANVYGHANINEVKDIIVNDLKIPLKVRE